MFEERIQRICTAKRTTRAKLERSLNLRNGALKTPNFKCIEALSAYGVDLNYLFGRSNEMFLPTRKINVKISSHKEGYAILTDEERMREYYPEYTKEQFKDVIFGHKVMIVSILEQHDVQGSPVLITKHAI